MCNNGVISAKSVDVTSQIGESEECYSSLLNVTVNNSMRNKTIECIHDRNNIGPSHVGNTTLTFTTGILTITYTFCVCHAKLCIGWYYCDKLTQQFVH